MSYTKHGFTTGGTIQAAPFNAMEDQIAANETAISSLSAQKLNKPAANGTAGQILKTNGDGTTAWINAPSGGNGAAVDATLSEAGQAADAKAAGDALALKASAADLAALRNAVGDFCTNLMPSGHGEATVNGVQIVYQDGVCTMTGTGTASGGRNTRIKTFTLPAGTYTISRSGNMPSASYLCLAPNGDERYAFTTSPTAITLAQESEVFLGFNIAEGTVYDCEISYEISSENLTPVLTGAKDIVAREALSGKAAAIDLAALAARVTVLEGTSAAISSDVKEALLQIALKVAYIDDGGQSYYQNLYNALNSVRSLSSISAVLTLGAHTVYEDDTLNSLQPYLTVTAHYSDGGTATVIGYTLGGALAVGTSTITVSYEGKTTAFTVTVASLLPTGYTRLAYVAATGEQYIDTGLTHAQPDRAEYDIMYTAMPSNKGGHILSNTTTYFPFFKGSTGDASTKVVQAKYRHNEEFIGSNSYEWALNTRYKLEGFPNTNIKVNDVTVCSLSEGDTSGSSNFYLFTYGGNITATQYRFYGRLYYAKVWDDSGVLLRSFVPCKNSSNVAGLYDTVTGTFYTSDTETALVAGEVA